MSVCSFLHTAHPLYCMEQILDLLIPLSAMNRFEVRSYVGLAGRDARFSIRFFFSLSRGFFRLLRALASKLTLFEFLAAGV